MPKHYSRHVWLLFAAVATMACVSWRQEPVPQSGSRAATRLPSEILVVTADGRTTTVRDPEIVGDSLIGSEAGRNDNARSIRLALRDIRELEARRPDAGRSLLMATAIGVGSFALFALLLAGEGS
jgi:hypothetical protein